MNNSIQRVICLCLMTLIMACKESPTPVDPCSDTEWATAVKNGVEVCFPEISVTYSFQNTENAIVVLAAGQAVKKEINAEFSIPVEGIELHKDYPLKEGRIFGADSFTEGKINFLVFDLPSQSEAGCIAGTFSLKAINPDGPGNFEYTAGRFVYFRGAMSQDKQVDGAVVCNPF